MSAHMLMREQMILAVFIISLTLGAKTKLQIAVLLRPSADRAFVPGDLRILPHLMAEFLPPADLLRRHARHIPRHQEEQKEMRGRSTD